MSNKRLQDKRLQDNRLRDLDVDIHDLDGDGVNDEWAERAVWLVGALLVFAASFWLAVQVASLLCLNWVPLGAGVKAIPGAILRLKSHFGNPALAWPEPLQPLLPRAMFFWPLVIAFFVAEGFYGRRAFYAWRRRRNPNHDRGGTSWASEKKLEVIYDVKKNEKLKDGVVLGVSEGGHLLRLEPDNHALVVAGTRSGKTAGLCTPALLTFPGVVIATSVKNDLVENTLVRRQKMGKVFIFDPVGAMGLPEEEVAGWTPLENSREWRDAQRTASALIDVAMSQSGGSGNMEFFKRMSQQTLPVLLYAAAVMDEDMRRVIRWLYRINDKQTHAEVDAILRWKNNVKALDAWIGFVTKDPKLRGDIAATMASALVSYEDEKVQRNAMRCDIKPEELFDGGANTLYVVAPMAEQARLEPIFVSMMQGLLMWVSEQSRPLSTPCLAVLDEAANIAAMPLLPELLSTIGSQHVSIITAWQDFSQIKARYGDKKNTILNNSRGKLVLPSVSDPETLNFFADVTGETVEETVSVSKPQQGMKSVSIGEGRRRLLTPAAIREQEVGEAILVYGHLPPAKIKLRMWFKDKELQRLAAGEELRSGVAGAKLSKPRFKNPLQTLAEKIPVVNKS